MDTLVSKLVSFIIKQPIRGDDFVDRLHYIVTVAIMFIFAFAAGLQEYVGNPIDCWTPLEFPDGADSYHLHINSYCWTHELTYPKFQKDSFLISKSHGILGMNKPKPLINVGTAFFRWVTLIFIVQACFFKIPNFLWRQISTSSGADLEKIRELGQEAQTAENEEKKRLKMDEVVAFFENWITDYRVYRLRLAGKHSAKILSVLFCFGKRSGNFLSSLYLSIKILNFINVVGNFFLLAVFLDINFWKYGIVVLNSVINYGEWHDPYNFPRLLICDFILEGQNGNDTSSPTPQEFQIQCSMTVNLLLEKIFVIEWFWLAFLFFVSFINLVYWGMRIKPPLSTVLFMKSYNLESPTAKDNKLTTNGHWPKYGQRDFIENYVRSDGVFVLRMLELNSDKALVGDVVSHLWKRYRAMHSCKTSLGKAENGKCNNGSKSTLIQLDDERKETEIVIAQTRM